MYEKQWDHMVRQACDGGQIFLRGIQHDDRPVVDRLQLLYDICPYASWLLWALVDADSGRVEHILGKEVWEQLQSTHPDLFRELGDIKLIAWDSTVSADVIREHISFGYALQLWRETWS